MKKTKFIILAALLFGLMPLALTSCSDNDNYSPGDEPGVSDKGVYFSSDNESEFVKSDEDEKFITITVERENTQGELAVPIEVVSKTDNIDEITSEAVFADGESQAELTITYTDLETTQSCELKIPDEYANPYKEKDGSYRHTVSIYKPRVISSNVTYRSYDESTPDYFSGATSELVQYGTSNVFILTNILGSGIDLKFTIGGEDSYFDATDVTNSYGGILPLNHYYDDGEYGWYLMVDEDADAYGECATWTVPGSAYGVNSYMYFYNYYSGSHYNYISLTPIEYEGEVYNGYFYNTIIDDVACSFYFDINYD